MPIAPQLSRPADRDRLLAIACGFGLAAVALLLGMDYRLDRRSRADAPVLARLAHAQGRVMRRPAGTLEWEPAAAGEALRADDSLYVPPEASASVEFASGSTMEVEERSLVIIQAPEAPRPETRLALLKGAVSGSAGRAPMTVRAGGRDAAVIDPGAAARVTAGPGGPSLEVLAGGARLGGTTLSAASQVRLDAPARNQRIWTARFPATVTLAWEGGAAVGLRVQAARDPGFEHPLTSDPAEPGRLDVEIPEAGWWYWRIADAAGRPRSETRRLVLVEDLPPRPFAPMAGEIVLAPPGVQVPFWWTAVDAASRYRLEIAAEPSFHNLAFSGTASGPGLWAALDLPEGVYYWRVRVDQPERGESPFSAYSPFRLIQRPLPDAPRLFDPTLEVEHGSAR